MLFNIRRSSTKVAELLLYAAEAVACLRLVASAGMGTKTTTETKIFKHINEDNRLNEDGLKRLTELLEFRNAVAKDFDAEVVAPKS